MRDHTEHPAAVRAHAILAAVHAAWHKHPDQAEGWQAEYETPEARMTLSVQKNHPDQPWQKGYEHIYERGYSGHHEIVLQIVLEQPVDWIRPSSPQGRAYHALAGSMDIVLAGDTLEEAQEYVEHTLAEQLRSLIEHGVVR
jgi:hypothetical protein